MTVVSPLRDRLQASLGAAYTLERELGGGGMSRVWVATETALGRQVVVKVIASELTEGMSAERFTREVRLAARLQQANVVPVLAAGDAAGMPYYTMPYVRGESLRARIAGGLPRTFESKAPQSDTLPTVKDSFDVTVQPSSLILASKMLAIRAS